MGEAFADNKPMLEQVLGSLFAIARADGAVNAKEHAFLTSVHRAFRLDRPVLRARLHGTAGREPVTKVSFFARIT